MLISWLIQFENLKISVVSKLFEFARHNLRFQTSKSVMVQSDAELSSASSILSGSSGSECAESEAGSVKTPSKRKMSKAGSKAEKQKKKRRKRSKGSKGDDDDGDKNCDDCAADPTEEDPVRQLAIQKQKHELESGL